MNPAVIPQAPPGYYMHPTLTYPMQVPQPPVLYTTQVQQPQPPPPFPQLQPPLQPTVLAPAAKPVVPTSGATQTAPTVADPRYLTNFGDK